MRLVKIVCFAALVTAAAFTTVCGLPFFGIGTNTGLTDDLLKTFNGMNEKEILLASDACNLSEPQKNKCQNVGNEAGKLCHHCRSLHSAPVTSDDCKISSHDKMLCADQVYEDMCGTCVGALFEVLASTLCKKVDAHGKAYCRYRARRDNRRVTCSECFDNIQSTGKWYGTLTKGFIDAHLTDDEQICAPGTDRWCGQDVFTQKVCKCCKNNHNCARDLTGAAIRTPEDHFEYLNVEKCQNIKDSDMALCTNQGSAVKTSCSECEKFVLPTPPPPPPPPPPAKKHNCQQHGDKNQCRNPRPGR